MAGGLATAVLEYTVTRGAVKAAQIRSSAGTQPVPGWWPQPRS